MGFRKARMNRLFAKTGKCFDVAVDHGFFNEGAFLGGIEDLDKAVKTIVDAGPDAIQLTVGQARLLQDILGPGSPRSSSAPTSPTSTTPSSTTCCSAR